MMPAVASAALSAPQRASQGPEPLGTRACGRSALYGARKALPCPSAPSLIAPGAEAPRMALGATHNLEPVARARKHAGPSAGVSAALLAGPVKAEGLRP